MGLSFSFGVGVCSDLIMNAIAFCRCVCFEANIDEFVASARTTQKDTIGLAYLVTNDDRRGFM